MPKFKLTEYEDQEILRCLGASFFRMQAEYTALTGGQLDIFPYRAELQKFSKPTSWRREIWNKLLNTCLKEVTNTKVGNDYLSYGKLIGLMHSVTEAVNSFSDEECELADESFEAYGYEDDSEINLEDLNFSQRTTDELNSITNEINKKAPNELHNFLMGYATGRRRVFGDIKEGQDIRPKVTTDATYIYFFLLIYGDFDVS